MFNVKLLLNAVNTLVLFFKSITSSIKVESSFFEKSRRGGIFITYRYFAYIAENIECQVLTQCYEHTAFIL